MITGVIGLAGPLFYHDPFPVARSAPYFRVYIILAISALREVSFTVVKRAPADISGRRLAVTILNRVQQVSRLLRNLLCLVTCRSGRFERGGWCGIICSPVKDIGVVRRRCESPLDLSDRAAYGADHERQAEEHRRHKACDPIHHAGLMLVEQETLSRALNGGQ